MPLNKLDNFIKNTEGRILYVSPSDLDSTDSITNSGNSLAQPFKTLQRALLESARFSYVKGNNNDYTERTTILLMPGAHVIDNRPGFAVYSNGGNATAVSPSGQTSAAVDTLSLTLDSNFDLTQDDNILYKFNSVYGGVIVPRGTSVVGLDLRKTKLRPKYVPNPTDSGVQKSAIFRITGACYFWQFSLYDGDETGLVYTDPSDFSNNNQSTPTFSHHKLTCFEYADGVNSVTSYDLTDLDMYYSKLSNAYNLASGRDIDEKYPSTPLGFAKQRPEWEIVGAFANDPVQISNIISGSGDGTVGPQITVTTTTPHNFIEGTPIKIRGVAVSDYNVSSKVQGVINETTFTYLIENIKPNIPYNPSATGATATIETDTVSGASPYVFNISLRSVWGMNGMWADGSKASGFRSMVVAQFTGVSLQKDDRAFAKYNNTSRNYESLAISRVSASDLSGQSSSTTTGTAYHLDSEAIYRTGWETSHIKVSNDSFIQIVSVFAIGFTKHFDCETGGDMSITNSNSNFGQISLNSFGFKKEAFAKDDKAFVTSIIPPRAIVGEEANVDWMALDVGITTNTSINPGANRLYLYGFDSPDDYPPVLTQGFRIGAKISDKLYFFVNGTEYSANILMSDGITSSVKEYSASVPNGSYIFTLGTHNLNTGEKVIILSDDGDLPENIVENTTYYAIKVSNTEIKLASSASNASTGTPISVYGGTNLRILSRVSEKNAGDIGSPIQYDSTNKNWFIHTNANSGIYNVLNSLGVANLSARTEPSYFKRIIDSRSLDEKIYKIRVVIPKESVNAKNPENSFVIQQSSSTGYRNNTDFNASSITRTDYDYNRNLSLIANCSYNSLSKIVTVQSELSHNLRVNDTVIIRYVTDSTNPIGTYDRGYNGTFVVASVTDAMTFTYALPAIRTPGTFTNNTTNRTIASPRFERNNLQINPYAYRNEIIQEYIEGIQDGVYHIYVLTANNSIPGEFSGLKYSQNVVDLYPQLDRDNINDIPQKSKTFAKRSPLGEVVTSDLKKSITKEATDTFLTSLGIGLNVSAVSGASNQIITFNREHGLAGIATYNSLTPGTGHVDGTYYNVKIFSNGGLTTWNGATAKVVVSGGIIVSANIQSSGSGYSSGSTLYFDTGVLGVGSSVPSITINTSTISIPTGYVVQFTGSSTSSDSYYRILSITSGNSLLGRTQISIAKTAGDPVITTDQYAFIVGPSVQITSSPYTSNYTTFNCTSPHGLVAGNRFRVTDSSNNNLGDFIVDARVGVNTFTAITNKTISATNGWILKHGLSANNGVSDSSAENLAVRGVSIFDNQTLTAVSFRDAIYIKVSPTSPGIVNRFPLGSYIQIDDEIMRIVSSTLSGTSSDEITVIRGALATRQTDHDNGSIIKKIKPLPIEFRRPSIIRASGHTFEYLGYGPGNYSTGLPQVQVKTLTEREDFLSQSQERSGGIVVYTGMNSKGDSFVGNQKKSSATGEEITFDTPIPTITGVDPSRLSVVFDEVTIKERLVVEGGNSNAVLSQFDGPVTFNKEVKINNQVTLTKPANSNATFTLKINDVEDSTSTTTGALIVKGGVGIGKTLNVGGNLNVIGKTTLTGLLNVTGATTLSSTLAVTGATTLNTTLTVTSGGITASGQTVTASTFSGNATTATTATNLNRSVSAGNGLTGGGSLTGNITLDVGAGDGITVSSDEIKVDGSVVRTSGDQSIGGTKTFTSAIICDGDITAFAGSDKRLKTNIETIDNALDKVIQISGVKYNWNELAEGKDITVREVGVIAQEIKEVLPEVVIERDTGYLAVRYEKLVPLLIEAVKELSGKVDELQQKLNDK